MNIGPAAGYERQQILLIRVRPIPDPHSVGQLYKLACRGHNRMINQNLSRVRCHLKMRLFRSRVVKDLLLANQKVSDELQSPHVLSFFQKKLGNGTVRSVFMASASRTQVSEYIVGIFLHFHEWHPPSQVFCFSHPHPTAA